MRFGRRRSRGSSGRRPGRRRHGARRHRRNESGPRRLALLSPPGVARTTRGDRTLRRSRSDGLPHGVELRGERLRLVEALRDDGDGMIHAHQPGRVAAFPVGERAPREWCRRVGLGMGRRRPNRCGRPGQLLERPVDGREPAWFTSLFLSAATKRRWTQYRDVEAGARQARLERRAQLTLLVTSASGGAPRTPQQRLEQAVRRARAGVRKFCRRRRAARGIPEIRTPGRPEQPAHAVVAARDVALGAGDVQDDVLARAARSSRRASASNRRGR